NQTGALWLTLPGLERRELGEHLVNVGINRKGFAEARGQVALGKDADDPPSAFGNLALHHVDLDVTDFPLTRAPAGCSLGIRPLLSITNAVTVKMQQHLDGLIVATHIARNQRNRFLLGRFSCIGSDSILVSFLLMGLIRVMVS